MKRLVLPLVIAIGAIGLSVAEFAYRYPQLPDRVASHFNAAERADGWTSKRQFTTMWLEGVGILTFVFAMACVVMWISPAAGLNLPRKDYWLAPERVAQTRCMVIERMLWFAAALMLHMAYLAHEAIAVNLRGDGRLAVWTPMAVFLTFTVLWSAEMLWRFQRVPRELQE